MTISEHVQACRIRGEQSPILRCSNGTELLIEAGATSAGCHPMTDDGPWTMFRVSWWGGPKPDPEWPHDKANAQAVLAGHLVEVLERLGWPEAQLGRRWKKRGAAAGRKA